MAAPELALTVHQLWAGLVIAGVKPVENRVWRPAYRGDIWLHAGTGADPIAEWMYPHLVHAENTAGPQIWARGAVLGVVELVGAHKDAGCCRPWGMPGQWHWEMAVKRVLAEPVAMRGRRKLWRAPAGFVADAWEPNERREEDQRNDGEPVIGRMGEAPDDQSTPATSDEEAALFVVGSRLRASLETPESWAAGEMSPERAAQLARARARRAAP